MEARVLKSAVALFRGEQVKDVDTVVTAWKSDNQVGRVTKLEDLEAAVSSIFASSEIRKQITVNHGTIKPETEIEG